MSKIDEILNKKHKINTSDYFENIINKHRAVINVSPKIDMICGGGIREGSMVIVSGPQKTGKTVFCLQTAANAQNLDDGVHRRVYYLNIEGRLNPRDLEGIHGLKTDHHNFVPIGSSEGQILSAEDYLTIAEDIMHNTTNSILIFDSFSMMSSRSEREYDYKDGFRMDAQKLCAIFCRKNAGVLGINNNIAMGILHLHANQNASGPFSKKTVESGGTKVQYAADYKFLFKYFDDWKATDNEQIGQNVYLECAWSPLSRPGMESCFRLRYGYGIDDVQETIDLALDFGLIKKSGTWYYPKHDVKIQGNEKLKQYFVENKDQFGDLTKQVCELIYV